MRKLENIQFKGIYDKNKHFIHAIFTHQDTNKKNMVRTYLGKKNVFQLLPIRHK